MEAFMEGDGALTLFPFISPQQLYLLRLVSRSLAKTIDSDFPWDCWIKYSLQVERAELHPNFTRLHISPYHVLCVETSKLSSAQYRNLAMTFARFPRLQNTNGRDS